MPGINDVEHEIDQATAVIATMQFIVLSGYPFEPRAIHSRTPLRSARVVESKDSPRINFIPPSRRDFSDPARSRKSLLGLAFEGGEVVALKLWVYRRTTIRLRNAQSLALLSTILMPCGSGTAHGASAYGIVLPSDNNLPQRMPAMQRLDRGSPLS
jgi:hypothetical protein